MKSQMEYWDNKALYAKKHSRDNDLKSMVEVA
jgi:hypothetical protein